MFKQNKIVNLFVNASIYANAGADISQQLTFTLLHLNEYLNSLFQNKQKASVNVLVQFAFGSNYFLKLLNLMPLEYWQRISLSLMF